MSQAKAGGVGGNRPPTAVSAPPEPEPERSPADILSRTVRLTLGNREWSLPVLTIAGNRRWLAELDATLGSVLDGLRKAGKNASETEHLYALLNGQIDKMLALLRSYDHTGVLPADLEEIAYEDELTAAVQEVWRAANPLVDIALRGIETSALLASSGPTSSPQRSGAGLLERLRN